MKMQVKCNVCGAVLGELEKDIITQDDLDLYQEMMACSQDAQQDIQPAVIDETQG